MKHLSRLLIRTILIISPLFPVAACTGIADSFHYDRFADVTRQLIYTTSAAIDTLKNTDLATAQIIAGLLPNKSIIVESIRYKTVSPNGRRVYASGLIARPKDEPVAGVISALHHTITDASEAPSITMMTPDITMALLNYVVIVSDYIGYGSTARLTHPYLHVENTGRVQADMVLAAGEYLKHKHNIDIDSYGGLYVMGYSQGGASSVDFMKVVQRDYSDKIQIKKAFIGGAPLDLNVCMNTVMRDTVSGYPVGIALVPIGLNYAENLNLNFNNLFSGRLLENYPEWILSKKYDTSSINDSIGTTDAREFLHADFFTEEKNPDILKLIDAAYRNSTTHGWTPASPIYMMHGIYDEAVPYENVQAAYDYFISKGCDVVLDDRYGTHTSTAVLFYLEMLGTMKSLLL